MRVVKWQRRNVVPISITLYTFLSFMLYFLPSQPFLVPYLIDIKGFTLDDVYRRIFPVWMYTTILSFLVIGILSRIIPFKLLLFLGILCNIVTYVILLFCNSLIAMIVTEITNSIFYCVVVLTPLVIFGLVSKEDYKILASLSRGTSIAGTVLSSILGQFILNYVTHGNPELLFYMSLVSVILSLFLSLLFPVNWNRNWDIKAGLKNALFAVKKTFSDFDVVFLNLWFWLSFATDSLVITYWQTLFLEMDAKNDYNGIINAFSSTIAASGALTSGFLGIRLDTLKPLLLLSACASGYFLFVLPYANMLVVGAMCLTLHRACFESMLPLVFAAIAEKMDNSHFHAGEDKFGEERKSLSVSVISLNLFIVYLIQMILQAILNQKVFIIDVRGQFLIYSLMEFLLVIILSVMLSFRTIAQFIALQR